MRQLCWVLVGGLVVNACGGGGNGGTGPTPDAIAVNAGNNQVAAAGSALPESLAAIVRDQNGAPVAGVNVTFAVTSGGGSVSPATRATDASGIAKTRRTLGPNAGAQTTSATVGGLAPAAFSAIAQIQGAVNIANGTTGVLTDTVDAIKAESLTVLVTDQNTTPVQGVVVTWASDGGSVSATSVPTSAAGLSKVRFTYGPGAGNQTATGTVPGLVGSPITITLNATAGTAVTIAKVAGDNGAAAPSSQVTYTVQSRDTHGNAKGGVTIDWAVATGGGTIAPAQNTTQANGNASAQRTLSGVVGPHTATATAAALASSPTVTFTTTAATVTTVQVGPGNTFSPVAVTIARNAAVNWEWQGTTVQPHNVTFAIAAGAPANILDKTSGSEARQFTTAGTFNYTCTNHVGMGGSVTVTP
jgi:plastocyanin